MLRQSERLSHDDRARMVEHRRESKEDDARIRKMHDVAARHMSAPAQQSLHTTVETLFDAWNSMDRQTGVTSIIGVTWLTALLGLQLKGDDTKTRVLLREMVSELGIQNAMIDAAARSEPPPLVRSEHVPFSFSGISVPRVDEPREAPEDPVFAKELEDAGKRRRERLKRRNEYDQAARRAYLSIVDDDASNAEFARWYPPEHREHMSPLWDAFHESSQQAHNA